MPPVLSIVIVSLNVSDFLSENLRSIFRAPSNIPFEVIVVDNASTDGTKEMIHTSFPQVRLLALAKNYGFGKACNKGVELARGKHILFLNPDMQLSAKTMERVVRAFEEDPSIGAVTVRLLKEDGSPVFSIRRDPSLTFSLLLFLKLPHLFPDLLRHEQCKDFDFDCAQDVEQTRGAFLAIRRDVWNRVGAFDERFFLWFEDVDLCRRIRRAGWRIRYIPDASAVDLVGRCVAKIRWLKRQQMFFTSMVKYFWKWRGMPPTL